MIKTKEISHFSPRQRRAIADSFAINAKTTENTLKRLGINGFSRRNIAAMLGKSAGMDALTPGLITQPSIPTAVQFLQNWIPEVVRTVTATRDIDDIVGQTVAGTWIDEQVVQPVLERTGQAVPYSDYGDGHNASWSMNLVARNIVRFEEDLTVGQLEEGRSAAMRISSAAEKREAAAESLEIARNEIGFLGYSDGENRIYGLLNDPNLSAYVTATNNAAGTSTNWEDKTYLEIQADILLAISTLQTNCKGRYNPKRDRAIFAVSLAVEQWLNKSNEFGKTVAQWLAETYPQIEVKTSVYFDGANGGANVAYLFAEQIGGSRTIDQYVQDTVRFLGVENKGKSYIEYYSNATAGVMVRVPIGVFRMTGI